VGFCGFDRERRPLRGDEIRPCWEARTEGDEAPAAGIPRSAPTPATYVEDRTPVRRLEFVEVGASVVGSGRAGERRSRNRAGEDGEIEPAEVRSDAAFALEASGAIEPGPPETRWSLWGDLET